MHTSTYRYGTPGVPAVAGGADVPGEAGGRAGDLPSGPGPRRAARPRMRTALYLNFKRGLEQEVLELGQFFFLIIFFFSPPSGPNKLWNLKNGVIVFERPAFSAVFSGSC